MVTQKAFFLAMYFRARISSFVCDQVFERGLKAIPLSVDLWIHYLNYCRAEQKDEEFLRGEYEKAIDACGMEFK